MSVGPIILGCMSTTETTESGRKRAGRPAGRKYTQIVQAYLSPAEDAEVRELAAKRGRTVSALTREALLAEVIRQRQREAFEAALDQLTPDELADIRRAQADDPGWTPEDEAAWHEE